MRAPRQLVVMILLAVVGATPAIADTTDPPAACGGRAVELKAGERLVERTLWFHGEGSVGNADAAADREEWRYRRLTMTPEPPVGDTSRVLASNGSGGGNPVLPYNFLMGYWHHRLDRPVRIVCAEATVYAATTSGQLPVQLWVDEFHRFDVPRWTATATAPAGAVAAYTARIPEIDVVARDQLLLELATSVPGATAMYDSTAHPSALTMVVVEPGPPPLDEGQDADPEPCPQAAAWFAPARTPVGNLAATGADGFPTWVAQPPMQSHVGGGAYVVTRALDAQLGEHQPHSSFTAVGTFQGCLDTIAVEGYLLRPPGVTFVNGASQGVRPRVTVDGVEVYGERALVGPLLWTEPNPRDANSRRFRIAFTGIDAIMRANPERFAELDGTHTIQVNLNPQFVQTDTTVHIFGTIEHPGGIVFNLGPHKLRSGGYLTLPAGA